MMAYQGYEGVLPVYSDVFDEEIAIAEHLHFSSILIYIRAKNPKVMIKNPSDYIERRGGNWQSGVQDRYDLMIPSKYAPLYNLTVHVDEEYNYSMSVEQIVSYLRLSEQALLDSRGSMKLRKRLKACHIFSCMRQAKKQRKLPF